MKIFSRNKKVSINEFQNSNKSRNINSNIPNTLPKTALDDVLFKENKMRSDLNSSVKDAKKISQEILKVEPEKKRQYSNEIRYIPSNYDANKFEKKMIDIKKESSKIKSKDDLETKKQITPSNYLHTSSFLTVLKKFLKRKETSIHDITSKELVDKFKSYHEALRTGHDFFIHESDIDIKIENKMNELQSLENEWLSGKRLVDEAERVLLEKEMFVENKFDELKSLMASGEKFRLFHTSCPKEYVFVFENGKTIGSIQELLYFLPIMSDHLFFKHVTESKNDFSIWIKNVFGSEKLANIIFGSKSREDMIRKIRSF